MEKTAVEKVRASAMRALLSLKDSYEQWQENHQKIYQGNLNSDDYKKTQEEIAETQVFIENGKRRVEEMEFSIGIIGTLKAGKSTVINSIVGHEIAPSRSEAMTVLPCIITHNPEKKEPRLYLDNTKEGRDTISEIITTILECDKGLGKKIEGQHLQDTYRQLPKSPSAFNKKLEDNDIAAVISWVNDVCRIAKFFAEGAHRKDKLNGLISKLLTADVLRVELAFFGLEQTENSIGNLTIIDTAGFNENLLGEELKFATRSLLKDSSAVVCIVNANQSGTEAEGSLREWLKEGREVFICANQKDSYDGGEKILKENNLKKFGKVVPELKEKDIFPTDARTGLYSSRLLRHYEMNREYPVPQPKDSKDAMACMIEACFRVRKLKNFDADTWTFSNDDAAEFTKFLEEEYKESGIPKMIGDIFVHIANNVVHKVFENCAKTLRRKVCTFNEDNQIIMLSIDKDLETLEKEVVQLAELEKEADKVLKDSKNVPAKVVDNIKQELQELKDALQEKVSESLDELIEESSNVQDATAKLVTARREDNGLLDGLVQTANVPSIMQSLRSLFKTISSGVNSGNINEIRRKNKEFKDSVNHFINDLNTSISEQLLDKSDQFKLLMQKEIATLEKCFHDHAEELDTFMGENYASVSFECPKIEIPMPEVSMEAMEDFMISNTQSVNKSGVGNLIARGLGTFFSFFGVDTDDWGTELITTYSFDARRARATLKKKIEEYLTNMNKALRVFVEEDLEKKIEEACTEVRNAIGDKKRAIGSGIELRRSKHVPIDEVKKI